MFNKQEQAIIKYGLENGKTKQQVEEAIKNYRLGITPPKVEVPKQSFLQDAVSDIKQTGSEIKSNFINRINKTNEILEDPKQSTTRSTLQLAGQGAGAVSDIIGSTIKGSIKAVLPQSAETAIKSSVKSVAEPIMKSPVFQTVMAKYNQLDPKIKRDIDAAIGFGSLALDIGMINPAKEAGETITKGAIKQGSKAIDTALDVAKVGTKAIKPVGDYTASRVPKLLGIFSGESNDVIEQAIKNPEIAKLGLQNGDDAIRNAVKEGSENSIKVRNNFIKGYSDAKKEVLGQYSKTLVSKNEVKTILDNLLKKNNVSIGKGGRLDFTKSKIIANPGEIQKITNAYDALAKWERFDINSLDEYKQLVGRLTKFADDAGIPSKSPTLGQFYNELNNIAKTKLPKDVAEKYIAINKSFADGIELYDDVVDAFNSGDPFTKLANSLSKNKDTLRQVLDFYEQKTGKSVLPIVAGRELAMEKQAAFGLLNPRSWIDFFISPKLQGEIILEVGKRLPKK